MNRRVFSFSAAATGLAALAPLAPAAQATKVASAAVGNSQFMYGWAVSAARSGGITTPAQLAAKIQVPPVLAQQLFARLVQAGVILVPAETGKRALEALWDAADLEGEQKEVSA